MLDNMILHGLATTDTFPSQDILRKQIRGRLELRPEIKYRVCSVIHETNSIKYFYSKLILQKPNIFLKASPYMNTPLSMALTPICILMVLYSQNSVENACYIFLKVLQIAKTMTYRLEFNSGYKNKSSNRSVRPLLGQLCDTMFRTNGAKSLRKTCWNQLYANFPHQMLVCDDLMHN